MCEQCPLYCLSAYCMTLLQKQCSLSEPGAGAEECDDSGLGTGPT